MTYVASIWQEVGRVQDDVSGVGDSRSSEAAEGREKRQSAAESETSVNWAPAGRRTAVCILLYQYSNQWCSQNSHNHDQDSRLQDQDQDLSLRPRQ